MASPGKLSATERIRRPGGPAVSAAAPRPTQLAARPQETVPCPFTGDMVEIKMVSSDGLFMGVGPFWSTRFFTTRNELLAALRGRPEKTVAPPRLEVSSGAEPEEDPVADLRKLASTPVDGAEDVVKGNA